MPEAPVLEYAPSKYPRGLLGWFATGPDRPLLPPDEIDRVYRRKRIQLMLTIMLGYGLMYTCRLGFNVVKKPLIDAGIFSASDLGFIGSALMFGYGLGRLVNGFLADHANLRRFFAAGVLLSAAANLVMGIAPIFWVWVALWGLNGWFQGFGAPSCIVSVARWFGPSERGRAYGIWSISHSLGEGLNYVGTSVLVVLFGWHAGFLGPATLCALLAVAIVVLMLDRPQTFGLPPVTQWRPRTHGFEVISGNESSDRTRLEDRSQPTPEEADEPSTFWTQLSILKLPALWIVCLATGAMYMTRYAMLSWSTLYLQEAKHYSLQSAGLFVGLTTVAGIVGSAAYGFISDNVFGARRPPATLLFGVLEVGSLLLIFGPYDHPIVLGSALVVYNFSLCGLVAVLGGLFAVDIVPKKAAGAAIGLTGIFSYVAGGIQDQISGVLIEAGKSTVGGTVHYDFSKPIAFWIGCSVVSLILATSLWRVRMRE